MAVSAISLLAASTALLGAAPPTITTAVASPARRAPVPCLQQAREPDRGSYPLLLVPEPALAIGASLLLLLVGNRLFTDELLNSQSRADLIATIAPVLIVLKALSDLDITPKQADAVPLDGAEVAWADPSVAPSARQELEWAADALLANEPCAAVAVYVEGQQSADGAAPIGRTLLLRGRLPTGGSDPAASAMPSPAVVPGPLLAKCLGRTNGAPEYLPALQLLPGRVEFGYLPAATQGVLMLPFQSCKGALILACDRQRGFNQEEVSWARATAARLGDTLSSAAIGISR